MGGVTLQKAIFSDYTIVNIICPGGHVEADAISAEISHDHAKMYRYTRTNRRGYGHITAIVYIVTFGD